MNAKRETFDKAERLCSRKIISELFNSGNIFYTSLFKIVWNKSPVLLPAPAQVTFSVSKRGFRLAVTRNLIKRRMREAYRKNKSVLYDILTASNNQIAFVIIVKGDKVPDYQYVEKSIREVFDKLIFLNKEAEGGRQ